MKKSAFCAACVRAFVLGFFCCSLFSRAAYAQDFSSIDNDLSQLENLINDTLANTEAQQTQLEDLKKTLSESGNIIAAYENIMTTQENSLETSRTRLDEMPETYKAQEEPKSRLLGSSLERKFIYTGGVQPRLPIGLVREIRTKLKILEDFYADSGSGGGGD